MKKYQNFRLGQTILSLLPERYEKTCRVVGVEDPIVVDGRDNAINQYIQVKFNDGTVTGWKNSNLFRFSSD